MFNLRKLYLLHFFPKNIRQKALTKNGNRIQELEKIQEQRI